MAFHGWPGTPVAKDRVAIVLRAAAPLTAWLTTHVGDSDLPAARH